LYILVEQQAFMLELSALMTPRKLSVSTTNSCGPPVCRLKPGVN